MLLYQAVHAQMISNQTIIDTNKQMLAQTQQMLTTLVQLQSSNTKANKRYPKVTKKKLKM